MPIRIHSSRLVSWVVVDREEKGNSLDYGHAMGLASAVEEACRDGETVIVALRGAGERFFSTGIDLNWVASLGSVEGAASLVYEAFKRVIQAMLECKKPVVAAVNGHAVGIAFELVQLADMAVAVRGARLGVPAVKWGMVPPVTTTLTPILYGYKVASYLALSGRLVTAEEAERLGVVNAVVDNVAQLEGWVEDLASDVSKLDSWAVAQTRMLLLRSSITSLLELGLHAFAVSAARRETSEKASTFSKKK